MTGTEVAAFGCWRDNGELIADAHRLGYIGDRVLDLSFGHGSFWTTHHPPCLVTNDLNPNKGNHHFDVHDDPPDHWWDQFDTVVWDPDYRLSGTRGGGENDWRVEFDERFGLDRDDNEWEPIDLILDRIRAGVRFAAKCVAPKGTVLVKCQDQVNSGRMVWQTIIVVDEAAEHDLWYRDRFDFPVRSQKQPAGRAQRHARHNTSQLLVFGANP